MEQKYDFNQIPKGWQFCFNADCPMHDTCLRYQTGQQLPDDYTWGSAVFPPSLKDGKCEFYRTDEKVVMATGFVVASNPRMSDMFVSMRRRLTHYLGGNGTYYLYRNGKKWLSPRQQEDIRRMFRAAGYKEDVVFGREKEDYDFT